MNEIVYWLRDLVQWLRDSIGSKRSKVFNVLEHHISEDKQCEAWLLCNDVCDCGLTGMVAFWLIRHHSSAESDLLLLCFNTAQIREAYHGAHDANRDWRRKFEVSARLNLKLQAGILSTHLVMVAWVEKQARSIRFVEGETDCYKSIRCASCYAVDFQGHSVAWMGSNGSAIKIMRDIALRCNRLTPGVLTTWESLLRGLSISDRKTTWLTWIEAYSRREIDKDHILQPRKVRPKLKNRKEPPTDD